MESKLIMPTYRILAKKLHEKQFTAFNLKTKTMAEFKMDATIFHFDEDEPQLELNEFLTKMTQELVELGKELGLEIKLQQIGRQ